jgi:aspartate-semialdehyde dehydrogenase
VSARIPVTVLGATGVVGQRFVARLAAHPEFEVRHLCASERSTGKPYSEACAWRLPATQGPQYGGLAQSKLAACSVAEAFAPLIFSALDTAPAREIEPAFAAAGAWVFSNASAFRMEADVPLLIPEVNPEHLELVRAQRERRGWRGAIVTNPNCTATVLAVALAPLHRAFGVEAVLATSLQAISGAGYPGVSGLDILGNVIPFIRGEEEKLEQETRKLLGELREGGVREAACEVSAHCHRVPVEDGHTLAVSVRLRGAPGVEAVREALESWRPLPQQLGLHSAPERPLRVHDAEDRPQVKRDVDRDGGMSVHVGRIRRCPLLGIKFSVLGHNAERGAAGASVLNAELALRQGWLADALP